VIDRAADHQRGRRVSALVHQDDEQLEGIQPAAGPEENAERRGDGERREEFAVEVALRFHVR
jgi:hypothetical protein